MQNFIRKTKDILLFGMISLIFVAGSYSSRAEPYYSTKITKKEKPILTFFRAGNNSPDYDFWIKSNPQYQSLPENLRSEFLLKETLRLDRGYGLHSNEAEPLEIKTKVFVKYIAATKDKAAYVTFEFPYQDKNFIPTFLYPYGSDSISLIVNRLANFAMLPLTDKQAEVIKTKITDEDYAVDATLYIHVRVTQSKNEPSYDSNGNKIWVMMGEVAYIKCEIESYYNTQGSRLLWDYVAPWHQASLKKSEPKGDKQYPHPFDLHKK